MRVMWRAAAVLGFGVCVPAALSGCGSNSGPQPHAGGSAGTSSGGGTNTDPNMSSDAGAGDSAGAGAGAGDGAGDGDGAPENKPCDPTTAALGAECINDASAVFVWEPGALYGPAQGSDLFNGTRTAPVASLSRAVELATKAEKPLVIVCGGDVVSGLNVEHLTRDVRIVGGFSCPGHGASGWQPSKSRTALVLETLSVTAPYDGHATVEVRNSTGQLTLENFALSFKTDLEKSPYGVQRIGAIFEKANVVVRNVGVQVEAGEAPPEPFATSNKYPSANDLDASSVENDPGCMVICAGGEMSAGGKGGTASTPAQPGLPAGAGGKAGAVGGGGSYTCAEYGANGGQGSDGASGKDGAGAADVGSIQNGVFAGTLGGSATAGTVGQGGGGSGALRYFKGLPGACGGCPGAPGVGGGAGGSSIAILSIDSTLVLDHSQLKTANGAPGAPGSAGQIGQTGGTSAHSAGPCNAGSGGKGGSGGNGGGGAGGLSVGVLYTGSAPQLINTTITFGLPGKGGLGKSQNSGIDGVAAETLELTPAKHCQGGAQKCGALSDNTSCAAAQGCAWQLACLSACHGDANTCAKLAGCVFQGNTCQSFGNDCESLATETACNAGTSCTWGVCTGTPTPCEMLSLDACTATPGCTVQ